MAKPESHVHAPAYAPLEDTSPRGHSQQPPPFTAQNQPPSNPGLLPARPVINRGEDVVYVLYRWKIFSVTGWLQGRVSLVID